ncbi:MAG: MotA/TolQ/ExbB proton channel family protein [Verrucomicrobia bacterium]|nr:MotA/TolQ/ExbB proton channel family protein [Verrucomicrobiota bacterium]
MNRLPYAISIFLILPSLVLAQADPEAAGESLSLWGMIRQGGWAMYPLGLCSLTMLFLFLHCWRETVKSRFVPGTGLELVEQSLAAGKIEEAVRRLSQLPTMLSRVMSKSLSRANVPFSDRNRNKVEATLVEALEGEENSISQWINYLNVIAAVAPMIGLLGTVSGMIGAFQSISTSGMGRPELFAGNIGEALITTATGLVIGIPSMIFFFVMRNRLNNAMLATVESANSLIDYLGGDLEARSED